MGPFEVHNTLHLTGDALDGTKEVIVKAQSALQASGSRLSKVLYGDIRVVGQIRGTNTLAWYLPNEDEVYLRPHLKVGRGEVHNLVHELGHRYWERFLDRGGQIEWHAAFVRVEGKKIIVPKVGDEVPVKGPKGHKGPVSVVKDEGYRYVLSTGGPSTRCASSGSSWRKLGSSLSPPPMQQRNPRSTSRRALPCTCWERYNQSTSRRSRGSSGPSRGWLGPPPHRGSLVRGGHA